MDLRDVGRRVKERRKKLGWSQQELAEKVGYADKGLISRIESGSLNISMDKMIKLADALGVNVADLLTNEPDVAVLPGGGFHGGSYLLEGLDSADRKKVIEYIELLRSAKKWQHQNGTESAGGSGSVSTAPLDLSQVQFLDEEDEKMWRDAQEKAGASPSSYRSEPRGKDTSKK